MVTQRKWQAVAHVIATDNLNSGSRPGLHDQNIPARSKQPFYRGLVTSRLRKTLTFQDDY